jgi:hypothetical protein
MFNRDFRGLHGPLPVGPRRQYCPDVCGQSNTIPSEDSDGESCPPVVETQVNEVNDFVESRPLRPTVGLGRRRVNPCVDIGDEVTASPIGGYNIA